MIGAEIAVEEGFDSTREVAFRSGCIDAYPAVEQRFEVKYISVGIFTGEEFLDEFEVVLAGDFVVETAVIAIGNQMANYAEIAQEGIVDKIVAVAVVPEKISPFNVNFPPYTLGCFFFLIAYISEGFKKLGFEMFEVGEGFAAEFILMYTSSVRLSSSRGRK